MVQLTFSDDLLGPLSKELLAHVELTDMLLSRGCFKTLVGRTACYHYQKAVGMYSRLKSFSPPPTKGARSKSRTKTKTKNLRSSFFSTEEEDEGDVSHDGNRAEERGVEPISVKSFLPESVTGGSGPNSILCAHGVYPVPLTASNRPLGLASSTSTSTAVQI